jgi:hypothetical protein
VTRLQRVCVAPQVLAQHAANVQDGDHLLFDKLFSSHLLTHTHTHTRQGDKDGNGRLDAREIHEAILKGGFTNVSFKAAQGLYNKYNRSGMGLNMAEFISIVAHIALARSVLERCVFFSRPFLSLLSLHC